MKAGISQPSFFVSNFWGVYPLFPILLLYLGYSWHIHGVFTGYSYVSVMCRLCIGYVSVMRRLCIGTSCVRAGARDARNKIRCRICEGL